MHAFTPHAVLGGLRLADPGITTEPRELTETQSRPRTQRGSRRVCVASSMQQKLEETQRKLLLIAKRNPRPTGSRADIAS